MQYGEALAVREKEIEGLLKIGASRKHELHFQGRLCSSPIYSVRVEMPKYRLENGRTAAAQQDRIAKESLPADYFDASKSESNDVQAAQHEILTSMAKSNDPNKDLIKYFEKNRQELPLILDCQGFVINGNRRLATFRNLYERDASIFGHFSNIDVVILPPCNPRDIDTLEARLQVAPDIREDYNWISLAFNLREKRKQYSEEELAAIYSIDEKAQQKLIAKLLIAEDYLRSRGKTGRYRELEKAEFAFEELSRGRKKLEAKPAKQEFFSEVVYRLIDSPDGDRLYKSIPDALEVVDQIREKLEAEVLGTAIQAEKQESKKPSDLFGGDFGSSEDSSFVIATKALKSTNEGARKAISDVIRNVIEEKKERDRMEKRGNIALESIKKANTALYDAVTSLKHQDTKDGIKEQLDGIDTSVAAIKTWLTQ